MDFNKRLLLLILILVISCKTERNNIVLPKKTDTYQAVIDTFYTKNPTAIGIMVHIESPKNGISWSGSVGYSDAEKNTELSPTQPALIASNIKTYISATILRLQEQGKLSIEDSISKYLSQKTGALFISDGYDLDHIKIKHLLSHTSGIEDYANKAYLDWVDQHQKHRWTRDEQLQLTIKVGDPLGKPGAMFNYADANYLLCTEIIEQITGKNFYTSIRELLKYSALNFTNTWFPTLEEKPINTLEMVHQYWAKRNWDSHNLDISWDLYGGGGIATNTKELAQFTSHLFNGNIIENKAILKLLFTKIKTTDGKDSNYCLGLSEGEISGLKSYGHEGFWGTTVAYIPQLDTSISVFILDRDQKHLKKIILETLVKELSKKHLSVANVSLLKHLKIE
ncbi:MAG: serine hydrolase [Flavobacteriaceae bacterium]|nr:serine hydrolase [Flavobacteriaceae bacterium]